MRTAHRRSDGEVEFLNLRIVAEFGSFLHIFAQVLVHLGIVEEEVEHVFLCPRLSSFIIGFRHDKDIVSLHQPRLERLFHERITWVGQLAVCDEHSLHIAVDNAFERPFEIWVLIIPHSFQQLLHVTGLMRNLLSLNGIVVLHFFREC